MIHKEVFIAFCFLLLIPAQLRAEVDCYFELDKPREVPVDEVFCVFQDSEGYMWYGTKGGGICRDNGYSIKVFRSDFTTPEIISSNYITCITEDNKGCIWFGTKRGLYIIDKTTYLVEEVDDRNVKNKTIDAISATADGSVWVAVINKLYRFSTDDKQVEDYSLNWFGEAGKISQVYEDQEKNIWIVQWRGGIYRFLPQKNTFFMYPWPYREYPTYLLQDIETRQYWVSTWGGGIKEFVPDADNEIDIFKLQDASFKEEDHPRRHIISLEQDAVLKNIWSITYDNIFLYKHSSSNELDPVVLSSDIPKGKLLLNDILSDKKGNMWLACDYPSSFVLTYFQKQTLYYNVPVMKEIKGVPVIPSMLCYENNGYWFWQDRDGWYYYSLKDSSLVDISRHSKLIKRKKSPIIERCGNNQGVFTFLDDTVLVRINTCDGGDLNIKRITSLPQNERAHVIHADDYNRLWIGTSNSLYCYDLSTKRLDKVLKNIGVIHDLNSTKDRTIFVATEKNGLLEIKNDTLKNSHHAASNYKTLCKGNNDVVWAGTQEGEVFYFDKSNENVVSISKYAGLNGDEVLDIEVDGKGNVWIITKHRIITYNPENRTSNIILNKHPSFPLDRFLCLNKAHDGLIHVGGIGGFCSVTHYKESKPDENVEVELTSISINGKPTIYGNDIHNIILQPNERSVELLLSTLDHVNAHQVRFAFRFKQEEAWKYLPTGNNSIVLTGLSSGDYTLEVKATNSIGQWGESVSKIYIIRLPAWYQTNWAYLTYVIMLISMLYATVYWFNSTKKRKLINEQIKNSAVDLHDLVHQLSGEYATSASLEEPSLKTLLIDIKTMLEKQRKQLETTGRSTEKTDTSKALSEANEKFIQKALLLVEKNIDNSQYTVEELSSNLGMDRTGLYRKLINIIGKTPTSFIRTVRLKRAARLLLEGHTVTETADLVGFGTSSYLSKCFKEEYGIKPSEYVATYESKKSDLY